MKHLHRWKTLLGLAAAVTAAGLSGPGTATAAPYEPNDSFAQASGPLVGGQAYDGAIETNNDEDWFYFYTSGQRQLDISLESLSGSGCSEPVLYDADGSYLRRGDWNGLVARMLYTAPTSTQYALRITGGTSCTYRLRVDPADAVTQQPPGVSVTVGPAQEPDDVQRLFRDGQLVAEVTGASSRTVNLGLLPATTQLRMEAENRSGDWSWAFAVTNENSRQRVTVLRENQDGGSSSTPRVGAVRSVTFTPSGGILHSCGEALAPVTCIPVDNDGDGVAREQDCDDATPGIRPGVPEVPGNAIDENCDGTVQARATTTVSLSRRGKGRKHRYAGRVRSTDGACLAGRTVVLRRKGSRRTYGTATTNRSGTFSIRRSRIRKARLYVTVSSSTVPAAVCGRAQTRSRRL